MNFVTYVAIAESTLVANEMSNAYHDDTPKESSGHRVLGVSSYQLMVPLVKKR